MMRPVIAIVTIMVSGILSGHCASAQSFRDLLDKGKEMLDNSNVGDIAADIISGTGNGLTAENICGTWNYVGTAIRFTSDNALADAARWHNHKGHNAGNHGVHANGRIPAIGAHLAIIHQTDKSHGHLGHPKRKSAGNNGKRHALLQTENGCRRVYSKYKALFRRNICGFFWF